MNGDSAAAPVAAAATTSEDANNNNDKNGDFIWYFAIGSMCHPTSISTRELHAIESFPGEVMDHRLEFFGPSGVAGAVPERGTTFHGVLHKMTKRDKEKLDAIEMLFDAAPCEVRLYDGSVVKDALIYAFNHEKAKEFRSRVAGSQKEDKPPTERYMTIIVEGCEHHGVKREHIDWLKSLEYQKRKDPSEFETLPVPENAPVMTMVDVEAADGVGDNPLYMTVNGKVIEIPKSEGGPAQKWFERCQKHKSGGMHSQEVALNSTLYDPLFGVVKTQSDVTKLCGASTEDMIATYTKKMTGNKSALKVVGLIDLPYKD